MHVSNKRDAAPVRDGCAGQLILELAVLVGTVADQSIKVRAGFHEQERVALCAVALTSD
jgi:hypothetical protein